MRKNSILVIGALILMPLAACKVEKTGEDTYQVQSPTPEAKAAGREAAADAREATQEISAEAKEAGKDVAAGAREATRETGKAVEKAGKKMQKHSKPGDQ